MSYEKDTYSLAKGIHHINIAKQYFEDVKMGCTGEMKNTFNSYINKCEWILSNMFDKLDLEKRKIYKQELSDSLGIDAINDQLMMLEIDQRVKVEELLEAIINGKEVTIKID